MNAASRWVLTLVVALAGMPTEAQQGGAASPLDKTIEDETGIFVIVTEEEPGIFVSAAPCAIPAMAARIAQAIGMPAGIEHAPDGCDGAQKIPPDAQRQRLAGLTARQALDRLVKLDPRYHWTESDGVVVMRPLKASADLSHFLHRIAPSFHLDAENFAAALHVVQSALSALPGAEGAGAAPPAGARSRTAHEVGGRTPQGSQPIAVHLNSATSAYDALNSVVRAHGAMRWRVTYCRPQARHEFAMMWMETYDGSALGNQPAAMDANGKTFDACAAR